jgi:hypothetical protein
MKTYYNYVMVFVNETLFSVRNDANGRNIQRSILNIRARPVVNVPIYDIDFVNLLLNVKRVRMICDNRPTDTQQGLAVAQLSMKLKLRDNDRANVFALLVLLAFPNLYLIKSYLRSSLPKRSLSFGCHHENPERISLHAHAFHKPTTLLNLITRIVFVEQYKSFSCLQ